MGRNFFGKPPDGPGKLSVTLASEAKQTEVKQTEFNPQHTQIGVDSKNNTHRKNLSIKIKRALFAEANFQCQHVETKTQVRCSGTHFLQVDHRVPLAKGGSDEFSNLRVLCQTHNLQAARDWGLN